MIKTTILGAEFELDVADLHALLKIEQSAQQKKPDCPCQSEAGEASIEPAAGVVVRSLLATDSVAYSYDGRGRLQVITFANGTTITYNHDAEGNRTSVVTSCSGGGC